jgi:hypothetical protein
MRLRSVYHSAEKRRRRDRENKIWSSVEGDDSSQVGVGDRQSLNHIHSRCEYKRAKARSHVIFERECVTRCERCYEGGRN